MQLKPIYSLQAGRALAAIAVVLHHAALTTSDLAGSNALTRLLEPGYLGVDFFFVLSGFIIAYSTIDRGRTFRSYSRARLRRIFLPYLPIGIFYGALYSVMGREVDWLPSLTLLPIGEPALTVAWTLQHEMLFYALFAIGYFVGGLRIILCLWAAAILAGLALQIPPSIFFNPINLEFICGVWLARNFQNANRFWTVSVGLILFWIFLGASRDLSFLFGLGLAGPIALLAKSSLEGSLSTPRTLVKLGDASYSLYLAHGIGISVASRLITPGELLLGTTILAGMGSGLLYFLLVEKPLMKMSYWKSNGQAT